MSYKPNNTQQMAIYDSQLSLTEREKRYLQDSWAETFSQKIFPFIQEDRFSVLYSANPASRLNNLTNIYLGLLILGRSLASQTKKHCIPCSLISDTNMHFIPLALPNSRYPKTA